MPVMIRRRGRTGRQVALHVVVWFHDVPLCCESALVDAVAAAGVGIYPIGPH